MRRLLRHPMILTAFVVVGLVLVVAELAAGDGVGALWAALRVLGRLA